MSTIWKRWPLIDLGAMLILIAILILMGVGSIRLLPPLVVWLVRYIGNVGWFDVYIRVML
eukprot:m.110962 g.110962  ORF g.110962 m.110962 type:complete len:60 (-) comp28081_c4_seq1:533-712(-)